MGSLSVDEDDRGLGLRGAEGNYGKSTDSLGQKTGIDGIPVPAKVVCSNSDSIEAADPQPSKDEGDFFDL